MAIIQSLLSVAENDVFKLLQLVGGDPLAVSLATLQGAGTAKGWFTAWSHRRSEQRITQGDSDEAAGKILAGMLRVEANAVPQHAKQHLLLILQAFGESWARALRSLPGGQAPRERDVMGQFATVLTLRWQAAFAHRPVSAQAQLDGLTRQASEDPSRSPYYQALWETLVDTSFDPPLYPREYKLLFEQCYRLAYSTALASPVGDEVRRYLRSLSTERPQFLRSLLISDLAGWGARQVFGNAMQPDPDLPDLPLKVLYVEPLAKLQDQSDEAPILGLLHEHLAAHPIVAVSASMGLGKSLTARVLAATLASEWLASSKVSPEVTLPIFVRCADALDAQNVQTLSQVVQRAQQLHARQLGFDLALDDPALAPPGSGQKVLYVLDGLDEVVLTESQIRDFFLHLDQERSSNVRFLVLSRPETLQVLRREELQRLNIPVLKLESFSTTGEDCQAAAWLKHWNQQVRQPAGKTLIFWPQVEEKNLSKLAATPILLFMIAETWDELPAQQVNHATLYEQFFHQLARGKHERDQGAEHKHIHEASRHLLQRLIERRSLASDAKEPEAMLWLMGRIAWKHYCLEQREENLYRHHVVQLLRDELRLRDASETTFQNVASGLMLALQADRLSEDPVILFGHKSFREFLVARYWQGQLRQLIDASPQEAPKLWAPLQEGRLLASADRSIEFLCDLLNPLAGAGDQSGPSIVVRNLIDLLGRQFLDVSQRIPAVEDLDDGATQKYPDSLLHDRRAVLREAALAISSLLAQRVGLHGIEIADCYTLRSLLAWFWLRGQEAIIRAPKLVHPKANLAGAQLNGADLREADLQGADLKNAKLQGAKLEKANLLGASLREADLLWADARSANLARANLAGADLESANFADVNLSDANLVETKLLRTKLQRARLDGATLRQAELLEANLQGANLERADLRYAYLPRARLQRASLKGAMLLNADLKFAYLLGAHLEGARLQRADLQGARLQRANLKGANLREANLEGANLEGANLEGANLDGANLKGTNLKGTNLKGTNLKGTFIRSYVSEGVDCSQPKEDEDQNPAEEQENDADNHAASL